MDMKLTREEHLNAIKEGVKEAFLTAMESGDGYTGPVILEPVLKAIKDGTYEALFESAPDCSYLKDDLIKAITSTISELHFPNRESILKAIESGTYRAVKEKK
jgi:hypothetical protein